METTWFENAVFYQFYPLGVCGSPESNSWDNSSWNGAASPLCTENPKNISKLKNWIPHLQKLGINAVYFSPIFQSDTHGYNTRDYYTIDSRLGSNEDFAALAEDFHNAGIRIVIDGVFNHVGRGFWAFKDLQQNKFNSKYKDWFFIDWNRNNGFNDGFHYENWEGCNDLVKLNLNNQEVRQHIFGAIEKWVNLFKIDGIRLDVAYLLDLDFCTSLHNFTRNLKSGINGTEAPILIGEILFNDYRQRVNPQMLDSCTNYECYKGLYSSFNDKNLFELDYSLNRQYGRNNMYSGLYLLNFADNHDVSRFATQLKDWDNLCAAYTALFAMPGMPCVYYGSEWAIKADKKEGDSKLRPRIEKPEWNFLSDRISKLSELKKNKTQLQSLTYRTESITNEAMIFARGENSELFCSLNLSADPQELQANSMYGNFKDLITGRTVFADGRINLNPHEAMILEKIG